MPVARLLDPVARRLPPLMRVALPLVRSLRDKRVIEAIGPFAFGGALSTSRFDKVSHILPSYQLTGTCAQWTEVAERQCDAHYAGFKGDRGAPVVPAPKAQAAAPDAAAQEKALDFLLGP